MLLIVQVIYQILRGSDPRLVKEVGDLVVHEHHSRQSKIRNPRIRWYLG